MRNVLTVTILSTIAIGIAHASVKRAFEEANLTPGIVETAPENLLEVKYGDKKVELGNEMAITAVQLKPKINYECKNDTDLYTLVMIDPDTPNLLCSQCVVLHWLVGNIPGEKVSEGKMLASYLMPIPIPLTGLHRYTFLLYGQPQGAITFHESFLGLGFITEKRLTFRLNEFIQKHNLGDPIAGNFFRAI